MKQIGSNSPFNWINFIDILDSSKLGLWSIEIDNNTGLNKMYCNDTMLQLMGITECFLPEKNYEFWYSRIHKGYYSYVENAIKKIYDSNKLIEIQYPWRHPKLGDIIVRCCGKLISSNNGIITIKGYHQNINDLYQMKVVLSKTENEIFEWYQDSNTAYIHTHYGQLYKERYNLENFPYIWLENGNVHKDFQQIYLDTFERINNGNKKSVCELKMKNKNGEYTWFRLTLSKEEISSEVSNVVIGTLENINSLKEMEMAYVTESKFYKSILKEMVAYGEANISKDRFLRTGGLWNIYNPVIDSLTISKVLERNVHKVIHPDDVQLYMNTLNSENLLNHYKNNKHTIKCEFRRIIAKETARWLELTVNLFQEPYKKEILALLYLRDIEDRKRNELMLNFDSGIDNLTGLFNHKYIEEEINNIFNNCKENDIFCMLLLEIEDFKNIKNLNGNIISDEILKYIGNLLKYIFEDSVIGRINTNKFVVFMKNNNKEDIEVQISEFYLRVKDFQEIYIPCNIGACLSNKSNYLKMYSACNKALYNLKNIENGENLVYWNNLILDENYEHFKTKLINNKENKVKNYNNINQLVANEGDSIAYVIDCFNYKIVDGNDAFFKMLNKTKEECINIECYKLIHNRERPCNLCKSIFWNSTDFFVWNQYNKVLNKDFLLKNKLVLFNQKKCMFTLATSISLVDERKNDNINQDISRSIVSAISHLSKKYNYEDNINFILELICSLYKSEFGFVFEIDKNDHISTHSLTKTSLSYDIKSKLSEIISDEFLSNPINNVRVLNGQQEVISVSYNLYNIMIKFHLYNMLIIPIINNKNHIGYIICLNNNKIEESIYYDKIEEYSNNISYFISEEIIKNTLKMELNFEKNYDNLTGVLNRNAYRSYEMAYDADNIKNIGVLCLALNELNSINHTAGVLAGDQVLLNLAEILKTQFYHKPIFRLNGNEFLIIMKNIKYELFLEEIEILSKSLEKVGLSMTYGKVWSSDEKELSYLVNSSIYFRKMESNKGRELITNNIYKRNTLFTELMLAIESNEYEIFLQPKISLKNDKLYGAEALIRKKNPEGGYIPPDKFIPILEHHYLIQYIDLFVFEEVCKLLQSWQNENKPLIPISLNFSRRTLLQEDIIKMVLDIKNKYNIDYKYVEVEVTESIGDLEKQAICIVLKDIEKMGISILLDDFGVKYSNLTILSEIDFDGLKLDKTMVKNLGQNTTNEIIMKNIISMCKDLNIKTTAEGVETIEQENILREMNCDIVQGYLHSKPLPVSEFLENFYNKNIE